MPRASSRSSVMAAGAPRRPRPRRRCRAGAASALAGPPRVLEGQADGHEPLLRAIVEVALEAASLVLAGLHDAGPRGVHRLPLRLQRRVQALVLDGQSEHGHDRTDECRVLAQDRVVDDGRQRPAVVLEHGHRVVAVLDGRSLSDGRPPSASPTVRIAADEAHAWIAERGAQCRLQSDG